MALTIYNISGSYTVSNLAIKARIHLKFETHIKMLEKKYMYSRNTNKITCNPHIDIKYIK
jgi:hypothetical protein